MSSGLLAQEPLAILAVQYIFVGTDRTLLGFKLLRFLLMPVQCHLRDKLHVVQSADDLGENVELTRVFPHLQVSATTLNSTLAFAQSISYSQPSMAGKNITSS